jgi:hypothetical protein
MSWRGTQTRPLTSRPPACLSFQFVTLHARNLSSRLEIRESRAQRHHCQSYWATCVALVSSTYDHKTLYSLLNLWIYYLSLYFSANHPLQISILFFAYLIHSLDPRIHHGLSTLSPHIQFVSMITETDDESGRTAHELGYECPGESINLLLSHDTPSGFDKVSAYCGRRYIYRYNDAGTWSNDATGPENAIIRLDAVEKDSGLCRKALPFHTLGTRFIIQR